MRCNVCDSPLGEPIFSSRSDTALTSLCERRTGRVQVWSCAHCGHLLGQPLAETATYYASDYRILLDHDDEDQIYELRDGEIVYRTDHQIDVLRQKMAVPEGAMLLDYGCAKASTPKRLLESRPDLQVHLFDVSDMYLQYWDRFVPPQRRAVNDTPQSWAGRFDVVTSFFALEHIPQPLETVRKVAALLKEGGLFYAIVPDTFGNVADFIVIDHVNHFTAPSVHTLLRQAGFDDIRIDSEAHRGALVIVARKAADGPAAGADRAADAAPGLQAVRGESAQLAAFWSALNDSIHDAERQHAGRELAIYGSGFYGAFIFTALRDSSRVRCFLDQSPYQQGKTLFDKPIVKPESLPDDVQVLFVGLNPKIARQTIEQLDWLRDRSVSTVFLDGPAT